MQLGWWYTLPEHMTENSCFAGKFGAFFASIPLPIFAAIYCVLYGIVGKYFPSSDICYPFLYFLLESH